MHIVKIDKEGWEAFTGSLGPVPFKNGVSERPLTEQEIGRIGASIRLVKVDSDEQVGPAVVMVDARNVSAEVKVALQTSEEEPEVVELKYDREKLEEIASEGGIKAVREIAKEFDVKGVEISKMIEDILKAQLGTE